MGVPQKDTLRRVSVLEPRREYAGVHLIAEFWHAKVIEEPKEIERILILAAEHARSTALRFSSHKFSPHGVTAFVLLAESHLSIHSWPEINYLAIDIFTCGDFSLPHRALEYLREVYQPKRIEIKEFKRGRIR